MHTHKPESEETGCSHQDDIRQSCCSGRLGRPLCHFDRCKLWLLASLALFYVGWLHHMLTITNKWLKRKCLKILQMRLQWCQLHKFLGHYAVRIIWHLSHFKIFYYEIVDLLRLLGQAYWVKLLVFNLILFLLNEQHKAFQTDIFE